MNSQNNNLLKLSKVFLTDKMRDFENIIEENKNKQAKLELSLVEMKNMNDVLLQSQECSLQLISDFSCLLSQYITCFDKVEDMIRQLNCEGSNRLILDHAKQLNQLSSSNIKTSCLECSHQLEELLPLYEQKNISTDAINQYMDILKYISN